MFDYRPDLTLTAVTAPIVAVRRVTPGDESAVEAGAPARSGASAKAVVIDVAAPGHNLVRYRPDDVTAAILGR
jgi:hypothetical protein